MKLGQVMSFLDVGLVPEEYREEFQRKLAELRDAAPKVSLQGHAQGDRGTSSTSRSTRSSRPSTRSRSPPPRSARSTARALHDGRDVAVKVQYPGVAAAVRADMQNLGMILRLMKRIAPGLDVKAIGDGDPRAHRRGARLRARGPEPARARAHLPRPPVHRRPRRRHARFARARDRQRVRRRAAASRSSSSCPQAERDRIGEIVFRFYFGCMYRHRQFSRRPAPGQLPAARRRARGVPGLRPVQAHHAPRRPSSSCRRQRAGHRGRRASELIAAPAPTAASSREPERFDAEELLAQFRDVDLVVHDDEEIELTPEIATAGDDRDVRPALAPLRQDAPRDAAARPPLRPPRWRCSRSPCSASCARRPTGTGSRASGSTATTPVTELGRARRPSSTRAAAVSRRASRCACALLALALLVGGGLRSSSRSAARCRPTACATASTASAPPGRSLFIAVSALADRRALPRARCWPAPAGCCSAPRWARRSRSSSATLGATLGLLRSSRWSAHDAVEELAGPRLRALRGVGRRGAASSRCSTRGSRRACRTTSSTTPPA